MVAVAVATSGFVALAVTPAQASVSIPSAPRAVRPTPGNGQAVVSWQKPLSNGGAVIDAYEVVTYLLEHPLPVNVFHSTALSETILNLTNGKTYTFKVAAHNAKGWSRFSAESGPIVVGTPGAPTNVVAMPGNAAATVSWTAASSSGSPITAYRVTPIKGVTTLAAHTFNDTATSHLITGLTNGSTYSFLVAAANARGWGAPSQQSADVIAGTPVAPTAVGGVPGVLRATVSWKAPATVNGSGITAYRVTPYVGSAAKPAHTFNSLATTQVITSLANGTVYRFRVEAHNSRGWGPRSGLSGPVTPGAPLAPTNVTAIAGSKQATVSWTAPTVDNGSPVGAYEVIPYHLGVALAARVFSTPATTQVVTGLPNGQPYRFRVLAHNSRGWGPMSAASDPVTPS